MKQLVRNRKSPLASAVLLIVMAVTSHGRTQTGGVNQDFRSHLVGAWRLMWLEEPAADGKNHRADCTGLLVYTRDGHMSVQVMYRNSDTPSGAAPVQYAQAGYEASFGTYEVHDLHSFTFHVEGALVRTLIGKDLKRVYDLSGNQLIVRSPNPNEHWRVAWERY